MKIEFCPLCDSNEFRHLLTDVQGNQYSKCKYCDLVFQNPRKVIEYEEEYWTSEKDPDGNIRNMMSDKERSFKVRNRMQQEIDYVNSKNGGKILDAGCGPGFFLAEIDSHWEKYGVEISDVNLDYIKENFEDIICKRSELENIPFENSFFDFIYCFQVLEHVADPKRIVHEFSRVLKPGGEIIISTPNIDSFVSKRFKGNYRLLGDGHIIMWSTKTIEILFERINYQISKVKYPFFKTDYFTWANLLRLIDTSKVSPPFYGNEMTIYLSKLSDPEIKDV